MTTLNAAARAAIREAGFTLGEWSRMHGHEGAWTGDECGCPDPRCANGFHHAGVYDCGCLGVLLSKAVAWRDATREPQQVKLAAPHGISNWVDVSATGVLVTVSATAGGIPLGSPAESVVRIEAREGWSAEVTHEESHGVRQMVIWDRWETGSGS